MNPNGPGEDARREGLDRVVVRQHGVVVDLSADRDLVLGLAQLSLQLLEVLGGPQLGVRLGDGEEPSERLAEDALGLRGLGRALRASARRRVPA